MNETNGKPFLRWAGGKTWLIPHFQRLIEGLQFSGYHEPFLGGGSVFFNLAKSKRTFLSDTNLDLINSYLQIRDSHSSVIDVLRTFRNTSEFYYDLRGRSMQCKITSAAKFIYLNQTSFNEIYRVNLRGEYNVLYEHQQKKFLQEDELRYASKKLKGVSLVYRDFSQTLRNVRRGDLVFLDPPYTITHNNNSFIKYNEKLFSHEDQKRLSTPIEVTRASLVSGNTTGRGSYNEYLFTNLPHTPIKTNSN